MTTETLDGRQVLADRLIESAVVGMELLSVHLGLKLGLYRVLRDLGSATEQDVATAAGVAVRYAREWLEQQCASSIVECVDPGTAAEQRHYELPRTHAEVLLDTSSLYHAAPLATMAAGIAAVVPELPEAYRSGAGLPYERYGRDTRAGIAGLNVPGFQSLLGTQWLPAVPELDTRLKAAPAARVLDLGCGLGASSIALARAYPRVRVTGVDLDKASVDTAREAAAAAGLADRVTFVRGDAGRLGDPGPFDLVTIFEALHDMGDPVGVLRTVRAALTPDGSVFVGDELVADEFAGPADLLERLQYVFSVLHCLPATMAESPVEANGTVLRAPTVARWAAEAGFASCDVLPIEHDFWRFYRLRHYVFDVSD